jgi:hypothetical protein
MWISATVAKENYILLKSINKNVHFTLYEVIFHTKKLGF